MIMWTYRTLKINGTMLYQISNKSPHFLPKTSVNKNSNDWNFDWDLLDVEKRGKQIDKNSKSNLQAIIVNTATRINFNSKSMKHISNSNIRTKYIKYISLFKKLPKKGNTCWSYITVYGPTFSQTNDMKPL